MMHLMFSFFSYLVFAVARVSTPVRPVHVKIHS